MLKFRYFAWHILCCRVQAGRSNKNTKWQKSATIQFVQDLACLIRVDTIQEKRIPKESPNRIGLIEPVHGWLCKVQATVHLSFT